MAGHVEHEAAVGEARRVLYADQGQGIVRHGLVAHAGHDVGREQFLEGLESVVEAGGGGGLERDAGSVDAELVALVAESGGGAGHAQKGFVVVGAYFHLAAGGGAEGVGKLVGLGRHVFGQAARADGEACRQLQAAGADGHLLGLRGEVHPFLGAGRAGKAQKQGQ